MDILNLMGLKNLLLKVDFPLFRRGGGGRGTKGEEAIDLTQDFATKILFKVQY